MKRSVVYELRLPKHVRIESVDVTSIPINPDWLVQVREDHRTIAETTLKNARQARY